MVLLQKDGSWEVIQQEFTDASFQELFAMNNIEEESEDNNSQLDKIVDRSKVWLDNIFTSLKKEIKNGIKFRN